MHTEMPIQNILQLLDIDELLLQNDPSAYDSYTIPNDTVLQINNPKDGVDEFVTITYVQVIWFESRYEIICQLAEYPSEPITLEFGSIIQVKVFQQINIK